MALAFIGLGGNMGDANQLIKDAIVCLAQYPELRIKTRSCMYQSAPVEATGNDFINAVIAIETSIQPKELLAICHQVENQFGRERPFLNAPRTLDLDLLIYDQIQLTDDYLTIPHPRLTERAFVLYPLLEISPDLDLPRLGKLSQYIKNVEHQRIEKIQGCCCPSNTI